METDDKIARVKDTVRNAIIDLAAIITHREFCLYKESAQDKLINALAELNSILQKLS